MANGKDGRLSYPELLKQTSAELAKEREADQATWDAANAEDRARLTLEVARETAKPPKDVKPAAAVDPARTTPQSETTPKNAEAARRKVQGGLTLREAFGENLPSGLQDLEQDYVLPVKPVPGDWNITADSTEIGGVEVPDLRTVGWGTLVPGLEVDTLREDLFKARRDKAVRDFVNREGRVPQLGDLDFQKMRQQAALDVERASQKIRGLGSSSIPGSRGALGGLALVSQDSTEQSMVRGWAEGGDLGDSVLDSVSPQYRQAIAPFVAAYYGSKVMTATEGGESSVYNLGSKAWGAVDWFLTLQSPSTYIATWMASDGWGTEEHLKRISRHEDVFSLSDDLEMDKTVRWANPIGTAVNEGIETGLQAVWGDYWEGYAEARNQTLGALAISIVEPDVISLATGGAGKLLSEGLPAAARLLNLDAASALASRADNIDLVAARHADALMAAKPGTKEFDRVLGAIRAEIAEGMGDRHAQQAVDALLAKVVARSRMTDPAVIGAAADAEEAIGRYRRMFNAPPPADPENLTRAEKAARTKAERNMRSLTGEPRTANQYYEQVVREADELELELADVEQQLDETLAALDVEGTPDTPVPGMDRIGPTWKGTEFRTTLAEAQKDLKARRAANRRRKAQLQNLMDEFAEQAEDGRVKAPGGRTLDMNQLQAALEEAEVQANLTSAMTKAVRGLLKPDGAVRLPANILDADAKGFRAFLKEVPLTLEEVRALKIHEARRGRKGNLQALQAYENRLVSALGRQKEDLYGVRGAMRGEEAQAWQRVDDAQITRERMRVLRKQYTHARLLERNIQNQLRMLDSLAAFADVEKTAPVSPAVRAQQLRESAEELTRAEAAFAAAPLDDVERADKALRAARDKMNRVLQAATNDDVRGVLKAQREALEKARENSRTIYDKMKAATDTAKEDLDLDLTPDLEEISKTFGEPGGKDVTVFRRIDEMLQDRAPAMTVIRALDTLGSQLRRASDQAKGMKGFGATTLSLQSQLQAKGAPMVRHLALSQLERMQHARGIKKWYGSMVAMLRAGLDPAVVKTGLRNAEANQLYANTMGAINLGKQELDLNIRGADTPEGKVRAVIDWVDKNDNAKILGVLWDSHGDRSVYQAALPLLRQMARDAKESDGVGDVTDFAPLLAIARAYLPRGDFNESQLTALTQKLVDLLDSDASPETFEALLEGVKKNTRQFLVDYRKVGSYQVDGSLAAEAPRATLYGALGVLQAAELSRGTALLRKRILAPYSDDVVQAAAKLTKAMEVTDEVGGGADFQEALDALATLGKSAFRREGRNATGKTDLTVLARPAQGGDEAVFVPRAWIQRTSELLENNIKQGQLYPGRSDTPGLSAILKVARDITRLYNASLITGLLLPMPKQFVNIYAGNFSQVWLRESPLTAAKFTAQGVLDLGSYAARRIGNLIPGIGKHLDQTFDHMVDLYGSDRALPSTLSSFMNPLVGAIMDPGVAKGSKVLRGPAGEFTVGELRKAMVEQGVFSSFAGTSGLMQQMNRFHDTTGWQELLDALQLTYRHNAELMDTLESRQRVALFLDLVMREGRTTDEAGALVREALYDWNYPMTAVETWFARNLLMFWGFQRRAFAQTARALVSPITDTDSMADLFSRTAMGSPGAALFGKKALPSTNIRDIARFQQFIEENLSRVGEGPVGEDLDGDGMVSPEEQRMQDMRAVYPWWLSGAGGSRAAIGNVVMDPYEANFMSRYTGKPMTHKTYTIPAFTPVEMTNNILGMMLAIPSLATSDVPSLEKAYETFDAFVAPMGGPVSEEMMRSVFSALLGPGEDQYNSSKGRRVTSQFDRAFFTFYDNIAQMLGAGSGLEGLKSLGVIWEGEEEGVLRADPKAYATYKAVMLPISYEAKYWLEPLMQMGKEQDAASTAAYVLQQWLGLPREHPHAPMEQLRWDTYKLGKEVEQMQRTTGRRDSGWRHILEGADPQSIRNRASEDLWETGQRAGGRRGRGKAPLDIDPTLLLD